MSPPTLFAKRELCKYPLVNILSDDPDLTKCKSATVTFDSIYIQYKFRAYYIKEKKKGVVEYPIDVGLHAWLSKSCNGFFHVSVKVWTR